MYAVVKAGGHQYRVAQGEEITIDRVDGKAGDKVTLKDVLLVSGDKTIVGSPLVSGASVEVTIKEQRFNDKVTIFKYRRRKNYKKTRGHKQPVTVVEVNKISH